MSLIVETGLALADAESLASVEQADAYHASRGNSLWSAVTPEEKEQVLRRATDFMSSVYRMRWTGSRVSSTQALDWPRQGVTLDGFAVPSTSVPVAVKNACAELALRAAGAELLPDLEMGSNQVKKDKTGPLETEYFENNVDARARFGAIDAMLEPYFGTKGGSGSIRLVRA